MFKSVCVLSALFLLGACSHKQPTKAYKSHRVSKSLFDLKFKKQVKTQADNRIPASDTKIPGLKEFIVALKKNPDFFKPPIGYEIVNEYLEFYDGKLEKSKNKAVYLKQSFQDYFVLHLSEEDGADFLLYEMEGVEEWVRDIAHRNGLQSVKKVSPTKFIVSSDHFKEGGTCQSEYDLTKSIYLQDSSCKDASGSLLFKRKVISAKPLNVQDYHSSLKSIKLEVMPKALYCENEDEEDYTCFPSVKDEKEKDWSYLFK